MFTYFFVLGRNQKLSAAEIKAVLSGDFTNGEGFLILETDKKIAAMEVLNRLGGSIKIGQVFSRSINENEIMGQILKGKGVKGKKLFFGFSLYGKIDTKIDKLAIGIKKKLKDMGFLSRWVTSKEKQLSSVIVEKNRLLKQGAEILIAKDEENIYVAKTLEVQEFEKYSKRDFGRPQRDLLSGTLPPKLAKIMINLAQAKEDDVILDPFCGSGTILQEAILLGYKKIIGSDISDKAIAGTKLNLEWLNSKYKVQSTMYNLYQVDACHLSSKISNQSVDAIITEPYLGPALKGNEPEHRIKVIVRELEKLYMDAFLEFKKILKPKAKVVIVFPQIKATGKIFELDILPQLRQSGFRLISEQDLIYSRQDQKVWRQILVFKLNN
ncbi:hypothetical protein C4569_03185 [Candidatus Parcubacteria bacterium]|nr:MAG: hypothetical protein C4569_03185 [Candidatus Parcubacteria bacterium]